MLENEPPQFAPLGRNQALRRVLASREALRQAFLLKEILGPPVALRDRDRDPAED